MSLAYKALKESNRKERELIIEFLRRSAGKILGQGVYSGEPYDLEAVHWMSEAIELAANAIEGEEHLERPD